MMQQPLRANSLLPHGPLARLGAVVECLPEIDGTNAYLLTRAAQLPDGALAVAEYQTNGRGRLGRAWHAPRGASILLSFLLHEPADSPLLENAGLLGALAACEAIEAATDCRPGLRWPNDLALAGRKLGGVLAESTPRGAGRALVVGVGINCLQQAGHFPPELRQKATSLEIASERAIDRAAVARALIERLDAHFCCAARRPIDATLRCSLAQRSVDLGTSAVLQSDGRTYTGTILDIDDKGDLLVELATGERRHFGAATTTRDW